MVRHLCPYSRKMRRYCKLLLILFLCLLAIFCIQKILKKSDSSDVSYKYKSSRLQEASTDYKNDASNDDALVQNPKALESNLDSKIQVENFNSQSIVNKLKPKIGKVENANIKLL